jgi:hypothetical protein
MVALFPSKDLRVTRLGDLIHGAPRLQKAAFIHRRVCRGLAVRAVRLL